MPCWLIAVNLRLYLKVTQRILASAAQRPPLEPKEVMTVEMMEMTAGSRTMTMEMTMTLEMTMEMTMTLEMTMEMTMANQTIFGMTIFRHSMMIFGCLGLTTTNKGTTVGMMTGYPGLLMMMIQLTMLLLTILDPTVTTMMIIIPPLQAKFLLKAQLTH